jgi:hypothetical protein
MADPLYPSMEEGGNDQVVGAKFSFDIHVLCFLGIFWYE